MQGLPPERPNPFAGAARARVMTEASVVSTTAALPSHHLTKRKVLERTCMHDCCIASIRTRCESLAIKSSIKKNEANWNSSVYSQAAICAHKHDDFVLERLRHKGSWAVMDIDIMAAPTCSPVDVTARAFSPHELEENCLVKTPTHCTGRKIE